MAAFGESTVELCLLTIKECFVYKVPPLRTASGHRAEDWGLANPLFTGCLKLFQSGDALRLAIYAFKDQKKTSITDENIQLFGECPIRESCYILNVVRIHLILCTIVFKRSQMLSQGKILSSLSTQLLTVQDIMW